MSRWGLALTTIGCVVAALAAPPLVRTLSPNLAVAATFLRAPQSLYYPERSRLDPWGEPLRYVLRDSRTDAPSGWLYSAGPDRVFAGGHGDDVRVSPELLVPAAYPLGWIRELLLGIALSVFWWTWGPFARSPRAGPGVEAARACVVALVPVVLVVVLVLCVVPAAAFVDSPTRASLEALRTRFGFAASRGALAGGCGLAVFMAALAARLRRSEAPGADRREDEAHAATSASGRGLARLGGGALVGAFCWWLALAPADAQEHTTDALREALARVLSEDVQVRMAARETLRTAGDAGVRVLVAAATDSSASHLQEAAIELLGAQGPAAADAAVAPLTSLLRVGSPISVPTARALAEMGPSAAPAVPALVRLLVESPETVLGVRTRRECCFALGEIGPGAAESAPVLAALLRSSPNDEVRRGAARALGALGAASVPLLLEALVAEDPEVRDLATIGCASVRRPVPDPIVRALVERLDDPSRRVVEGAVAALTAAGDDAKAAKGRLLRLLEGADDDLASRVRAALRWIQVPDVDPLIRSVGAGSESERRSAAERLGDLGGVAWRAVPALLECLADTTAPSGARQAAALAVGHIRSDADRIADALAQVLRDEDPAVRMAALEALGELVGDRRARPAVARRRFELLGACLDESSSEEARRFAKELLRALR